MKLLLASCLLALCLPACQARVPAGPEASALRFLGRVERLQGGGARYAWSGSGFMARFHGTGLAVTFDDAENLHTVVVDGQLREPLRVGGRRRLSVVEGLPLGEHTVELRRRTEAFLGTTTLLAVEVLDGALLPPGPEASRLIEIVGDSISCGYGNEGASSACSFSAETENHYMSYGALLARQLDAEVSTVAWSGRGVVRNYGGEAGALLPELYTKVLPNEDVVWSFERSADAVVINLGTNDFSTAPDPAPHRFAEAYEGLLRRVRYHNPRAFILCTVGPMLSGDDLEYARAGIDLAVKARRRAGDQNVEHVKLEIRNEAPGCDHHPSIETHRRLSAALQPLLQKRLGW